MPPVNSGEHVAHNFIKWVVTYLTMISADELGISKKNSMQYKSKHNKDKVTHLICSSLAILEYSWDETVFNKLAMSTAD